VDSEQERAAWRVGDRIHCYPPRTTEFTSDPSVAAVLARLKVLPENGFLDLSESDARDLLFEFDIWERQGRPVLWPMDLRVRDDLLALELKPPEEDGD
jgi:hypothetical protein